MSNPIFSQVDRQIQQSGYAGFNRDGQPAPVPVNNGNTPQQSGQYGSVPPIEVSGSHEGAVTRSSVIARTLTLFAIVVAAAIPAWSFAPEMPWLWAVGLVATLALSFAISFMKTVSVPLIMAFAVAEGILVGAVSATYAYAFPAESLFNSVITQAVLATGCVFLAMLVIYSTGIIKVNDKFRAVVGMATMGYFIFALVNLGYAWFTKTPFGIGGNSGIGIAISVFAVGLASLNLATDFDSIDRAVAARLPEKFSWKLAFGLVVTIVWLYLEMLRLFGRLNSRN